MKHYPHHIGDFDKATRHLSRIERSVYRDLIELYYDTEDQLMLDLTVLCRLVLARTNEEATAVEQMLNEFFSKTPTGWYHARCDAEIERYRTNSSQKALAGRASAEARALKAKQAFNGNQSSVEQPLNERATNRKPVTVNQEPIKTPAAEYSAEFELAWVAYPKREGASKKDAYKAWSARVKGGVLPSTLTAGAARYAAYCKAQCTEQQYIKQPATFFGVGEHYLADWKPTPVLKRGMPSAENFEDKDYGTGVNPL